MMKFRGSDDRSRVRIPENQIRVAADGNPALRTVQPRELGRRVTHPARDLLDTDAAAASGRPHSRQTELQRRDAAPGTKKMPVVDALQRGRCGRMIGCNEVDVSIDQSLPQSFAIAAIADRGGTLEWCGTVGDLLRREHQIVRTGFDRNRYPTRSRSPQQRHSGGRGEMHDVDPRLMLCCEFDQDTLSLRAPPLADGCAATLNRPAGLHRRGRRGAPATRHARAAELRAARGLAARHADRRR